MSIPLPFALQPKLSIGHPHWAVVRPHMDTAAPAALTETATSLCSSRRTRKPYHGPTLDAAKRPACSATTTTTVFSTITPPGASFPTRLRSAAPQRTPEHLASLSQFLIQPHARHAVAHKLPRRRWRASATTPSSRPRPSPQARPRPRSSRTRPAYPRTRGATARSASPRRTWATTTARRAWTSTA